ncbi:hypothetical protein M9Y10_003414 [Tritrichomonas musculus]|uniref:mitogen-activated protein kinase kinase n=1 Tax=Tritrichomonas musculus TaxID=1915356 RepID=A0ABR2JR70_9EUKA
MSTRQEKEKSPNNFGDPKIVFDVMFPIISDLLGPNEISKQDIILKSNQFSRDFLKYIDPLASYINGISDANTKAYYFQYIEAILYAYSLNTKGLLLFMENQTDAYQLLFGISSSYIILAFSLLNNETYSNTYNQLKATLVKSLTHFLQNSKTLNELQSSVIGFLNSIQKSNQNIFTLLLVKLSDILSESTSVFSSCNDYNNDEYIGKCLRQCDKLQTLLKSISLLMMDKKSPENVKKIGEIVSYYCLVFEYSADLYRLTTQIQTTKILKEFCPIVKSYVELLSEISSYQDESKQKDFSEIKSKMTEIIQNIEAAINNHFPFPVYDCQYCKKMASLYKSLIPFIEKSSKCTKEWKQKMEDKGKFMYILQDLMDSVYLANNITTLDLYIYFSDSFVVPNLIGILYNAELDKELSNIDIITKIIGTEPSNTSFHTLSFLKTLNEMTLFIEKVDPLSDIANALKEQFSMIYLTACHISIGDNEELPKITAYFEQIKRILVKIQPIFESFTDKLKSETENFLEERIKQKEKEMKDEEPNEPFKILDSDMMKDYEIIGEIGSGGGGRVLKVINKNNKKIYALKVMNVAKSSEDNIQSLRHFMHEYEIMGMLNHPNILKAYGIFLSNEKIPPSILLEFCPLNLNDAISKNIFTKIDLVCTIYQIALAMKYIHFQKIIHRDLKPSNILIARDGTVKICDFGIAKLMTAEQQLTTCGIGTQKFMAPEIINEEDYDEKVDVYSFGVLVFVILNDGKLPIIKIGDICRGKKAEMPETFTEFAKQLINSCWNYDPKDRPDFNHILDDMKVHKYALVDMKDHELQIVEAFVENHILLVPQF